MQPRPSDWRRLAIAVLLLLLAVTLWLNNQHDETARNVFIGVAVASALFSIALLYANFGLRELLLTTEGWAMGFCLLAAISPALPWNYQATLDRVSLSKMPSFSLTWQSAFAVWQGAVICVLGAICFFFVLATSPLTPAPWWRSLVVAVVAAALWAVVLTYALKWWNEFPAKAYGAYLGMASVVGLMFIAALEIRQTIQRRLAHVAPRSAEAYVGH